MFKKLFFITLLSLFAFVSESKEITIFHTSDIHGYYFIRKDAAGNLYGGFAVLENLLQKEKTPFIILDSGDWSSGNKEANDSDGRYSLELMNKAGKSKYNAVGAGYAALTIGNHDSDFGDERLKKSLKSFKGDLLAANIKNFDAGQRAFKIYYIDGVKTAVAGIALDGPGMTGMTMETVDAAFIQNILNDISSENPDVIIFISHDSIGDSRKPSAYLSAFSAAPDFARKVTLVLGGHAHVKLNDKSSGPLFVESGSFLDGVSRISIELDDDTKQVKNAAAEYIKLDAAVYGENPKIKKELNKIEDFSLREPAAYAPSLMPKYPSPGDASPAAAKLLSDNMYVWLKEREPEISLAAASLPAIRRDILPGAQTGRDLIEILPYAEYYSTVDVSGAHLKHVVAESLKHDSAGDYSMFSFSDNTRIVYAYDFSLGKAKICSFKINGAEVKDDAVYRLGIMPHLPEGYFEGAPFKTYKGPVDYRKKIYNGLNGLELKTSSDGFVEAVKNNGGVLAEPGDRVKDPRIRLVQACAEYKDLSFKKIPGNPKKYSKLSPIRLTIKKRRA